LQELFFLPLSIPFVHLDDIGRKRGTEKKDYVVKNKGGEPPPYKQKTKTKITPNLTFLLRLATFLHYKI
jgi:hypothetical protein